MMEETCRSIQELMAALIAGTLPTEKADAIRHHTSQCPACRGYLQALRSDDKLLGDFAEVMRPRVTGVEGSVVKALSREAAVEKVTSVSVCRKIVRTPVTKLAGAAGIVIAVIAGIYQFSSPIDGKNIAFADVLQQIHRARTVSYQQTFCPAEGAPFTLEEMVMEPGYKRSVSTHGNIVIFDFGTGSHLHLIPRSKRAILTHQVGLRRGKRLFNYLEFVGKLHEQSGEFTGREKIHGKMTEVFVVQKPFERTTVWVDPKTNLPVKVEMVHIANPNKNIMVPQMSLNLSDFGGQSNESRSIIITSGRGSGQGIQKDLKIVMSDFVWGADLDESLFSLEPPEGYTLEERQFDVSELGENGLIGALGFWAEMSGGSFPSVINDLGDPNKVGPMLVKKFDRDGDPEEEFDQAMKKMHIVLKGLMFAQQRKVEGSWHYGGKAVKLGDSETPICWWKAGDSEKCRVVYGDLRVGDANAGGLPEGP